MTYNGYEHWGEEFPTCIYVVKFSDQYGTCWRPAKDMAQAQKIVAGLKGRGQSSTVFWVDTTDMVEVGHVQDRGEPGDRVLHHPLPLRRERRRLRRQERCPSCMRLA